MRAMAGVEFLTQLLGDRLGEHGEIREVLAHGGEAEGTLPRVVAVIVGKGRSERAVVWPKGDTEYLPTEKDWHLKRDLMDKQIVDTADMRVVRVSDVRLAAAPDGGLVVVGVDPGQVAVLRRVLPEGWGDRVARALRIKDSPFIPWSEVEPTSHSDHGVLRLRTTRDALRKLHPADIADILEQMHPNDQAELLESLPVETAADVITEMQDDEARDVLERMDTEVAADIVEEMEPDDAADLLQDVSGAKRKEILDEMEEEEAHDVRELLTYDESSAGGLMTTEFVSLPSDLTAAQAIEKLREMAPEAETIYYIYVTEPDGTLVGVISLRDLIVAAPDQPLWNVMRESVIKVSVDANLEEVASALEHYDLMAVPVVDSTEHLLGIVTVDDTLEELLPASWRRKRFKRRS